MSSKKISEFPELEAIDVTNDDVMPIVNDATNKKFSWANIKTALSSIVVWGNITGTLADQTDLQSELDDKEDVSNKATDLSSNDNVHYPTTAAVQTAINSAVAGLLDYRGTYDASGGTWPSTGGSGASGAILKGDCWIISVAGTLGVPVSVGDLIIAKVDSPSATAWGILENNIGFTPENVANKDPDGTLSANSDTKYASQKATKTYADTKVTANPAITGAAKTKITYDAKGLITAGADATTADIADSTDKRYCTDAEKTVIGNTSGTNTGNETTSTIGALVNGASAATPNNSDLVTTVESSVVKKITWTNVKAFLKTYFDGLYPSGSGTSTGTNTGDQVIKGLISGTFDGLGNLLVVGSKVYVTCPYAGTITGWSITSVGSSPTCTIDVWKIATGTALPTVSNTIMGTKPALSTGNAIRSTTLTGWTTSISAGDIIAINLDAVTVSTWLCFEIEITKS